MKMILLYGALICAAFSSCDSLTSPSGNNSDKQNDNASASDKKGMTKRDYSITPATSYSDLFLDSNAMEKFFISKKISDTTARRIRSFYNARNYQFTWFTTNGLTEQARAFWNLHDYVTTYDKDTSLRDKSLQKKMEALTADEDLTASNSPEFVNTELLLTQHFIQYVLTNYEKGYVKRKEMERFIPYKKQEALVYADSLLNKKHKDDKYFENINEPYKLLKEQLAKYYPIAKNGGWPQINTSVKTLKKGASDPAIAVIKKRLHIVGMMPGGDSSTLFTDTLENAVKLFQQSMGYKPDGMVNALLVKDMNVPATLRLQQILMNMDRMRWMPQEPEGKLIIVNIPEFVLHVFENKKKAFDMNVVVGKEGHNTVSFNGDLSTIVFSPYWNVPASIVEKEILPKMASNRHYLEQQNMERMGTDDGLPVIRQKPGEKNSLGRVKFLFPNSFNIYFHDTPAKSLFSQDKRAYSHGCIRLAEPEKMAQYLLQGNPEWTPEKITEAMNQDHEVPVKLNKPVPVLISYSTAWVDENGLLNFRDDIYQHDLDLAKKMFL